MKKHPGNKRYSLYLTPSYRLYNIKRRAVAYHSNSLRDLVLKLNEILDRKHKPRFPWLFFHILEGGKAPDYKAKTILYISL